MLTITPTRMLNGIEIVRGTSEIAPGQRLVTFYPHFSWNFPSSISFLSTHDPLYNPILPTRTGFRVDPRTSQPDFQRLGGSFCTVAKKESPRLSAFGLSFGRKRQRRGGPI
jgi:hypothetical protein